MAFVLILHSLVMQGNSCFLDNSENQKIAEIQAKLPHN